MSVDTSAWMGLISLIAGATASVLGLTYRLNMQVHRRIDLLDEKWQERTIGLAKSITEEIREVQRSIPPDWFRSRVDENSRAIEKLRESIACCLNKTELREFVRMIKEDKEQS